MNNGNPHLPEWSIRLLKAFCPDHLFEEIEGDLIQNFHKDVSVFGIKKARRRLVWNAIRFIRPGIIFEKQI